MNAPSSDNSLVDAPAGDSSASPQAMLPGLRFWLAVFGFSLLIYALTAHRGIQWQDSGWQQYRITTGQMEHPYGLVLIHPLHYYLGRLFRLTGLLEPAFAITLVSCFAGAIAVANVGLVVARVSAQRLAGVFAAVTLGCGHLFWQHAAHTESYTLVIALLSAEWLLWAEIVRRQRLGLLPLVGFVSGLGLGNHMLAALAVPASFVIAVVLLRRSGRWGLLAGAAGLWLVGSLPYTWLVWSEYQATGNLVETINSALFAKYADEVLNASLNIKILIFSLAYTLYNFPGLGLPLALVGILKKRGGLFAGLLLLQLLTYGAFLLRYTIKDQYTFLTPLFAILAVFAGLGFAYLCVQRRWLTYVALATAVWTPLVYVVTAEVVRASGRMQRVSKRPYRDGYRAFLIPWGVGNDAVRRLNTHLFELTGDDGMVVIQPAMIRHAILYDQHQGVGPKDVSFVLAKTIRTHMTPDSIRALLEEHQQAGRAVVLVPSDRDKPEGVVPGAVWQRQGDLYVLEGWE